MGGAVRQAWIGFTLFALACGGASAPAPAPEPAPAPAPAPAPVAAPAVDWDALSPEEAKAKLLVIGEHVYTKGGSGGIACTTCHMPTGLGVPGAFPPLVGSEEEMGDCEKHATYVLKGVSGEMMVQGKKYQGVMPAQANLSDEEIAAVLTYERLSWGNDYGLCMPSAVAAARSKL